MILNRLFFILLQASFFFILTGCTFFKSKTDPGPVSEEEEYLQEDSLSAEETAQEGPGSEEEIEYADEEEDELIVSSEEGDDFPEETAGEDLPPSYTDDDSEEVYAESSEEFMDEDVSFGAEDENVSSSSPKTWVPVKKIPTAPWKKSGKWINAVYIARPGDTLNSVSAKIYGTADSAIELKNWNPHFSSKDPKVGDKIYYNSPQRPQDNNRFLNYYEDNGETAVSHDIQAGQNIRTVARQLLGHPDSWKEIWATNFNIESKDSINQTTTILYWVGKKDVVLPEEPPAEQQPSPVTAQTETETPPPSPADDPFADKEEGEEDPFASAEQPDMPEPSLEEIEPEPMTAEAGPQMNNQDSPPSSASEISSPSSKKGWSLKTKMALVGVIVFALGLILVRVIRSKKKAGSEFDFSKTNIDIDSIEE